MRISDVSGVSGYGEVRSGENKIQSLINQYFQDPSAANYNALHDALTAIATNKNFPQDQREIASELISTLEGMVAAPDKIAELEAELADPNISPEAKMAIQQRLAMLLNGKGPGIGKAYMDLVASGLYVG